MLFKTKNNKYIEIKRMNFKNDKLYYERIMQIKGFNKNEKKEKSSNDVIDELFRKLE